MPIGAASKGGADITRSVAVVAAKFLMKHCLKVDGPNSANCI